MSELFRKKALDRLSAPDRLDERVALIAPSWWVALAGRRPELLEAAIRSSGAPPHHALSVPTDVADPAARPRACAR